MEDFKELLEKYLDEEEIAKKREEIAKKREEDSSEELEIKNNKTINNFLITISIKDFVNYYLGTEHDCKNLKHRGLKSFNNPYVIGISNDFAAKNPDHVRRNEILVVIDDYGNPGTYINPNLLRKIKTMEECKHLLKLLQKVRIYNLEKINELYTEYMNIQNKILDLEKIYVDGCDLLYVLNKNNILRKIKKYVRESYEKRSEFNEQTEDIEKLLNNENSLITNLEELIKVKEKRK